MDRACHYTGEIDVVLSSNSLPVTHRLSEIDRQIKIEASVLQNERHFPQAEGPIAGAISTNFRGHPVNPDFTVQQ